MRKVIISMVVVLLAVGMVGVAGCSSKSSSGASASVAQSTKDMIIGGTAHLKDGLEVTVVETEAFTPQYYDHPMTRVLVMYTNNGDKKQSFNLLDWKAVDANGAERSITAWADGNSDLGSGNLQPGGTTSGNIYFDGTDISKIYYYNNVLFQNDSDVSWVVS